MELEFRTLTAREIECRVCHAGSNGVSIILYKDARVDQNILDEKVGPMNWQKTYARNNANCIVSIWDDDRGQWVSKEDTGSTTSSGSLEKEKSLASDSFKRACVNWGIGRELYTAPFITFHKNELRGFGLVDGKYACEDGFFVSEIIYEEKIISQISISVRDRNGEVYLTKTFKPAPGEVRNTLVFDREEKPRKPNPQPNNQAAATGYPLADNERLLIGNCRGKLFKEVKGTETFKSFLVWIKTASANYSDPKRIAQFNKLKEYAKKMV